MACAVFSAYVTCFLALKRITDWSSYLADGTLTTAVTVYTAVPQSQHILRSADMYLEKQKQRAAALACSSLISQ
jgi:uncharacterized transporter YbjL